MTDDRSLALVKLILAGMFCFLFLAAYVVYSSYEGRVTMVNAQQAGCERAKKDRSAAATVNDNIQKIFMASQATLPDIQSSERVIALAEIKKVNQGLIERSQIVCAEAFPKASLIP